MDAATDFNAAATAFTAKLERAMQAFDKDPQDLEPFFDCVQDMQQLRLALAKQFIAETEKPSEARTLAEQTLAIMIRGDDARRAFDADMTSVEANERLQRELRDCAAQLEEAAGRLRAVARQEPAFQSIFDAITPLREAFIPATQRVLAGRDELTQPLRDAVAASRDIEEQARRLGQMIEANTEQNKRLEGLAGDADVIVKKITFLCDTSRDYVQRLTAELSSCTDGVTTAISVRKALSLRKAEPVA